MSGLSAHKLISIGKSSTTNTGVGGNGDNEIGIANLSESVTLVTGFSNFRSATHIAFPSLPL